MTCGCSSPDYRLLEIPPEGYGLHKLEIKGRWSNEDGSAAGCGNYDNYLSNPVYRFETVSGKSVPPMTIIARLQVTDGTSLPMNLSLYPLVRASGPPCKGNPAVGGMMFPQPTGKYITPKKALASSNGAVYSDSHTGVKLSHTTEIPAATGSVGAAPPNHWALLPSTFKPKLTATFTILLYTSQPCRLFSG